MVMTAYHLERIKIASDELTKVKRLLIDIEQECELDMYDDTRLQSNMINASLVLLQGASESLSGIIYDNKDLLPSAGKMVPDVCHALMTLDEAIDHANEKSIGSSQCAAQHAQLAKWLTDYRAMLSAAPKLGGEL